MLISLVGCFHLPIRRLVHPLRPSFISLSFNFSTCFACFYHFLLDWNHLALFSAIDSAPADGHCSAGGFMNSGIPPRAATTHDGYWRLTRLISS